MKSLIKYFIKYSTLGNVVILLVVFLGLMGFGTLRSTLMPQIDLGVINIITTYPGASPEEVEQGVVLKIEENIQGISGIKRVTSTSMENIGTVTVELISGSDPDLVLQEIKNAVDGISSFPSGIEPPRTSKWEFRTEAVEFMINGNVDLHELKAEALRVEDDLLAMDGISKIVLKGYPDEEIEIAFRESDLDAYHLTLAEAVGMVRKANIDLTGGTIRGDTEDLSIRTRQKRYYAADMQDFVLRTLPDGTVLKLSMVADIHEKWAETPDAVYVNGKPAVLVSVNYTSNEDVIKTADMVKSYIQDFNEHNDVFEAQILRNAATSIESMQSILLNNGMFGFLLVLLFLSLALNPRMAFWVALSIPLSFLGMFGLAALADVTLNRISLFGMILVVGILVDDGIVIAENIYQHHERGKRRIRAAIDGALEVLPAVFSSVLTTMVAFSAFMLIEGTFGQFFREMAFVVMAALLISLIEAALILPAHIAHSRALAANRKPTIFEIKSNAALAWMRDFLYAPLYRYALNHRATVIAVVTGLFIITIGGVAGGIIQMGGSAFENQNMSTVDIQMPPGTPARKTMEVLDKLETNGMLIGKKYSDIEGKNVVTSIVKHISSSDAGTVTINFLDTRKRDFLSTDFSNAWRKAVGQVPEVERINYVETSQFGKAVSISLLGDNIEELDQAVDAFKSDLNDLAGLKNIIDDKQEGMREIEIELKDFAYNLGLDIQTVMGQIRNGFFGAEVQRINRGTEEVKIWVRYDRNDRSSIGDLEEMRIRTNQGQAFQLKSIANLHYTSSLSKIKHLNGQRQVTVEADALNKKVDLSQLRHEVEDVILPSIFEEYPGISYTTGGHEERKAEAKASMIKIMPMILVLLFAVITFTFRSFGQTAILMSLIPLGFIGIGWGHAIHGTPLDMPSYFGVLALIGILVNDSIVFIGTLNRNLKEGLVYMEALLKAGISRFRPILLTSLTTIAGLAPLILSNNPDAQMTIPMAISVAYGLMVSTFSTLLILPILLSFGNDLKRYKVRLMTGEMPSRESVESAVLELDIDAQLALDGQEES